MIDITPRDTNYSSHATMAAEGGYNRQTSQERDLTDVDGNIQFVFSLSHWNSLI